MSKKKSTRASPLKTYTVTLVRTIEHRAVVEDVQATSIQEAIDKAILYADSPYTKPSPWREGDVLGEDSKATVTKP